MPLRRAAAPSRCNEPLHRAAGAEPLAPPCHAFVRPAAAPLRPSRHSLAARRSRDVVRDRRVRRRAPRESPPPRRKSTLPHTRPCTRLALGHRRAGCASRRAIMGASRPPSIGAARRAPSVWPRRSATVAARRAAHSSHPASGQRRRPGSPRGRAPYHPLVDRTYWNSGILIGETRERRGRSQPFGGTHQRRLTPQRGASAAYNASGGQRSQAPSQ